MAAVTIGIADVEATKSRMPRAFEGHAQGKIMTPKRWELMRAMAGAGPLAIREIAHRLGRDVKSVHGDISALLKAGVIERTEDGRIAFPYDEIHVDFVLRAA